MPRPPHDEQREAAIRNWPSSRRCQAVGPGKHSSPTVQEADWNVRAAGGWRQAGLLGKLAGKAEARENLGSAEGCDGGDAGAPQRQHVEGDREVAALLPVEFAGAERQLPICAS